MSLDKIEWIWKHPIGALIAGAIAGSAVVAYLYQIQATTYKDQIAALQRAEDKMATQLKEEKTNSDTRLKEEAAKLTASYEGQLKAVAAENLLLRNSYQSLRDQYDTLAISYRNTASTLDKQANLSHLIADLRKQEQQLLSTIAERRQRIAALSNDVGESKQKYEDHQSGRNTFFVSASDCQRYESVSSLIKTIGDQVSSDERALSAVQGRIAALIQRNG